MLRPSVFVVHNNCSKHFNRHGYSFNVQDPSFNNPIPQRMPLTIKINPNLYDRQPTKSEALRVIAQIDLLKGYIRSPV